MNPERLVLVGKLQEAERELSAVTLTCDDIVKTIRNNINPTPPGTAYLDDINIEKFRIQSEHLLKQIQKRLDLKAAVAELKAVIG